MLGNDWGMSLGMSFGGQYEIAQSGDYLPHYASCQCVGAIGAPIYLLGNTPNRKYQMLYRLEGVQTSEQWLLMEQYGKRKNDFKILLRIHYECDALKIWKMAYEEVDREELRSVERS